MEDVQAAIRELRENSRGYASRVSPIYATSSLAPPGEAEQVTGYTGPHGRETRG